MTFAFLFFFNLLFNLLFNSIFSYFLKTKLNGAILFSCKNFQSTLCQSSIVDLSRIDPTDCSVVKQIGVENIHNICLETIGLEAATRYAMC